MKSFRKNYIFPFCIAFVIALLLPVSQALAETYSYDVTGRLISVAYDDGSGITYTYDNAGNITKKTKTDLATTVISISNSSTEVTLTSAGDAQQITATATYGDSSTTDATSSSIFISSNPSVATVSSSGLITAVANGTAIITASYGGKYATTSVTVTGVAVALSSIKSEPLDILLTTSGATSQLKITAFYNDGSRTDVTTTSAFSSLSKSVATVNSTGLITAGVNGVITITVTYSGKSAVSTVTVNNNITGSQSPEATLSGAPTAKVVSDSYTCDITVGGSGVTDYYRYSFDGSSFSTAILVSTKITDVLQPGAHILSVIGRNSVGLLGLWQSVENATTAGWYQEATTPPAIPVISITPATLDFGNNLNEKFVYISNIGTGTASWALAANDAWISIKIPSGTISEEIDSVAISVNRANKTAGNYRGSITLDAGAAGTKNINVYMSVDSQPVLNVNPVDINMGSSQTSKMIYITNQGGGTLNWTAAENSNWISLDISIGTTTTEKDEVVMSVDRTQMTTGENTSAVTFTDGNSNSIQVNVTAYKPDGTVTVSSMTTNPSNMDADGSSASTITATFSGCANLAVTFHANSGTFSGLSSATTTSNGSGVASVTYTASLISGIATIKAICNGVTGVASINLNDISFANAETEMAAADTATVDKKTTTGLSLDKDGTGTPTVTLGNYSSNPGGSANFNVTGSYFDAHLDNTEDLNTVTIKKWVTSVGTDTSTLGFYYVNGTTWEACSDTGYIADGSDSNYVGYIYATFTSSTTPTIDYLDGLPLVAGEGAAIPIPTLSEWGKMLFVLLLLLGGIFVIIHRRARGV